MVTLADAASNITDLLRRSDMTAAAKAEIGHAIRHYSRLATWVIERRGGEIALSASTVWYSTIDLTAGAGIEDNPSGTAPTSTEDLRGLIEPTFAKIEAGTIDYPIDIVSFRDFERLSSGTATGGVPTTITHHIGQIGVWPTPGSSYTLYLSGWFKPTVPTGDTDESVWLDQYQELVEVSAARRVAQKWLADDEEVARLLPLEIDQENLLVAEGYRRRRTGKIKIAAS